MLWVHGYTIDTSLWRPLWDRLPGWRHIGVDLPGHGASSPLSSEDSLPSLARRLADWSERAQVRHVVGLSLGSTVALQVVLERPDAFETLTMGAPAIGGGPAEADVGRRYVELLNMREQLGNGPWMAHRWMTSPPHLFTHARAKPLWPEVEAAVARHAWDELPGFAIGRLATHPQPLDAIAALRARLLLLVGEWELPAFVETARLIQSAKPRCATHRLPDAGHLCMLEAPDAAAPLLAAHWSG